MENSFGLWHPYLGSTSGLCISQTTQTPGSTVERKEITGQGSVTHVCNHSCEESGNQEDSGSRPAQAKS
jgi:hypothetical protein